MTTEFVGEGVEEKVYFKGGIVEKSAACISAFNPAAQFGLSVFEGIRYYKSSLGSQLLGFRVDSHFDRLRRSASMLGMRFDIDFEVFRNAIAAVLAENRVTCDAVVRAIIYPSHEGSWSYVGETDLFISVAPRGRIPRSTSGGLSCGISTWRRNDSMCLPPAIKMGANYINGRLGQLEAKAAGFDSAIFLNSRGTVAEAPGSCVAIVRDGRLILVPSYASVLDSITVNTVADLALSCGIEVSRREFDRIELVSATEAMLLGTTMEIVPISSVDRKALSSCPGPVTDKLTEEYFAAVRGQRHSAKGWITETLPLSTSI
jgi:branched-chain amino acid aminotransferase